jgi:hypothetical protein
MTSLEGEASLCATTWTFVDLWWRGSVAVILREFQPVTDRSGAELARFGIGPLGWNIRASLPLFQPLGPPRGYPALGVPAVSPGFAQVKCGWGTPGTSGTLSARGPLSPRKATRVRCGP